MVFAVGVERSVDYVEYRGAVLDVEVHRVLHVAAESGPVLRLEARGNGEMRRGQLDAAQTHLLKADDTPQASYARGILAAKRGDYTEAQEDF